MMKKFIRIQSDRNINVNAGLRNINMSNADAHVANRLNIAQAWTGTRVLIKKDVAYYPAVLKEWPAVKKLEELHIISFGEETDTVPAEYEAYANELVSKLKVADSNYARVLEQTSKDPQATEVKKSRPGTVKPATLFNEMSE